MLSSPQLATRAWCFPFARFAASHTAVPKEVTTTEPLALLCPKMQSLAEKKKCYNITYRHSFALKKPGSGGLCPQCSLKYNHEMTTVCVFVCVKVDYSAHLVQRGHGSRKSISATFSLPLS